jgi:hypothetical protein
MYSFDALALRRRVRQYFVRTSSEKAREAVFRTD